MEDLKFIREQKVRDAKSGLILDAAREVFTQKGFHDARLEDIAAAAGFSKASLYNYYSDKLEIFLNLATRDFNKLLEAINKETDVNAGVLENLSKSLHTIFSFFGAHFPFLLTVMNFRTMMSVMPQNVDSHEMLCSRLMENIESIRNILTELFAKAREAGQIHTTLDDYTLSGHVISLIRGVMIQWMHEAKAGEVDLEISHIIDFVANGIGINNTTNIFA